MISTVLCLFNDMLSLERNKQKTLIFVGILKATAKNLQDPIPELDPDPDP
jgi:hypothetical protein